MVNNDPYGDGWIVKIEVTNTEELSELLGAEDYEKLVN